MDCNEKNRIEEMSETLIEAGNAIRQKERMNEEVNSLEFSAQLNKWVINDLKKKLSKYEESGDTIYKKKMERAANKWAELEKLRTGKDSPEYWTFEIWVVFKDFIKVPPITG